MQYVYRAFRWPNGDPVPALYLTGERVTLTAGNVSSSATALPTGTPFIVVRSTDAAWIRFGNAGVGDAAAADHSVLFPPGVEAMPVPVDGSGVPYTHVKVIRAGSVDALMQFEAVNLSS